MHAVLPRLDAVRTSFPPLRRRSVSTLQVNLGYKCNQSCLHCHVAASPQRTEMMDGATVDLVIDCGEGSDGGKRDSGESAAPNCENVTVGP